MQANHQCEASGPLQSALKAKAKIVGIPIPGNAPLIFQRTKLQRMLKGVKPISVIAEVGEGKSRFLCIKGRAGAVRNTMRILSMSRYDAIRQMEDKEKALDRLTRPKSSKFDTAIRKLEKEMGAAPRILTGWNRKSREIDEDEREIWLHWRTSKMDRTASGRVWDTVTTGKRIRRICGVRNVTPNISLGATSQRRSESRSPAFSR
jgi:hypothetical protein